jgi:dephospho-CoA kinase
MKAFSYAVALTGGIATGKSSVAKIFRGLGCRVIDADTIAHEILDQEVQEVARRFGKGVVREGRIDRKRLGAIIFNHEVKRKQLEALLHPLIYQEIKRQSILLDRKKECYLVDIPLFFETRRYPIERVLVVSTSDALQLERLMQRDGSSLDDAQKRIDAQLPLAQKVTKADYLIENCGTLKELECRCQEVKRAIIHDIEKKGEVR